MSFRSPSISRLPPLALSGRGRSSSIRTARSSGLRRPILTIGGSPVECNDDHDGAAGRFEAPNAVAAPHAVDSTLARVDASLASVLAYWVTVDATLASVLAHWVAVDATLASVLAPWVAVDADVG